MYINIQRKKETKTRRQLDILKYIYTHIGIIRCCEKKIRMLKGDLKKFKYKHNRIYLYFLSSSARIYMCVVINHKTFCALKYMFG